MSVLLCCFLLGLACGMRSMMAPAAVAWGARLGWLHFAGTKFAVVANPVTLVVFTLFALGELAADKLPKAPARTAPPGLIARLVFGAGCAAALAASVGSGIGAACVAGAIGALAGTYGGFALRRALTVGRGQPDLPIALGEDVVAIVIAFLAVARA